jgi:hypothetical protein
MLRLRRIDCSFSGGQNKLIKKIEFLDECRRKYLDKSGNVDWNAV